MAPPLAYLFLAIFLAMVSFSPSSLSISATAIPSHGIPYPPPLPRSLLFHNDHSSLPQSPAAEEYPAKPLQRVNGERKDKCTEAPRNGNKDAKSSKDPWPKCPVSKSPPPPF
ncbi:hypothetical protein E5676_scaffold1163G00110 [Cucumis melo var. makuwa]|uniref:Uncharacterized protein n=1 Tax=Cucumis melo var. makuwa TaxID=1194695 RepID=A0A5D3DGG9_CUCMM|nr:hypothetical protein E6C27_scaffold43052G00340 [Cucumis melo var. makuwa]TYK22694.1 hypothetical protein E5676_scaffold1163G00110 [Cucumis melo var. makuwa]